MFSVKNQRLKHYRNRVWDEIEDFEAFSIEAIPKELNDKADSLAVSASLLIPHPNFINNKYSVKIIHRPSIPDNNNSWQVFKDDAHINAFLQSIEKFSTNYFEGSKSECREFCPDLIDEKSSDLL